MRFVLDASVTINWAMRDESNPVADLAFSALGSGSAVAPAIWWYEVRNILVVNERRQRITPADSNQFLVDLLGLEIAIDNDPDSAAILDYPDASAARYTTRPISRLRCANNCRWRPWISIWRQQLQQRELRF